MNKRSRPRRVQTFIYKQRIEKIKFPLFPKVRLIKISSQHTEATTSNNPVPDYIY